jgi:serine/threonine protein kinase
VLHDKGFLQRDVKPDVIRIGEGKKASVVYLTDFSIAKRFVCPNTGQHLKHLPDCGVHGTRRYLSPNANVGNQLSRTDDLIALGYVFVSLLKRNILPWDLAPLPEYHSDIKDPKYLEKQQ